MFGMFIFFELMEGNWIGKMAFAFVLYFNWMDGIVVDMDIQFTEKRFLKQFYVWTKMETETKIMAIQEIKK